MKIEYLGKKRYKVLEPFTLAGVTIPEGFITDIDSVPRIPFIYTLFKNRAIRASVMHDYLYFKKIPRNTADSLYLKAMTITNTKPIYKYPIYLAVRCFGWLFY